MKPIRAKKSLGQNFLIDHEALSDIANSIVITGKNIIEVGPGYGALTEYITRENPLNLDLVELDNDMIPLLEENYTGENIHLHHQDVLSFIPPYEKYSVIANIPYYITSPILFHFLYPQKGGKQGNGDSGVKHCLSDDDNVKIDEQSERERVGFTPETFGTFTPQGGTGSHESTEDILYKSPEEMTIMMQEEVGEKILEGRAQKPHHSYLSLAMEQACDNIEIVRYVGRDSFDPAPKVDSIVLKFTGKKNRNHELEKSLLNLWKIAFTHPRKTLLSNIRGSLYSVEHIRSILLELGYDERVRAEAIGREDWVRLL